MSFVSENYEELHRRTAGAIAQSHVFRQHHEPIAGAFRHPSADAYAYLALMTVATVMHEQDRVHIETHGGDPDEAARKIIEILTRYRRRHGGNNPLI